ncbi:MAG: DUF7824 domain-containing protein [Akkermansiaceae bacterium]
MIDLLFNCETDEDAISLILATDKAELLKLEVILLEKLEEHSYENRRELDIEDKVFGARRRALGKALLLLDAYKGSEATEFADFISTTSKEFANALCDVNPSWLLPELQEVVRGYDKMAVEVNSSKYGGSFGLGMYSFTNSFVVHAMRCFRGIYPYVKNGFLKRPVDSICYHSELRDLNIGEDGNWLDRASVREVLLADPELVTIDYIRLVELAAKEQGGTLDTGLMRSIHDLVKEEEGHFKRELLWSAYARAMSETLDHDYLLRLAYASIDLRKEGESGFDKSPILGACLNAIPRAKNEQVVREFIEKIDSLELVPEDYLDHFESCGSVIASPFVSSGKYVIRVLAKLLTHQKFKLEILLNELPVSLMSKSNPYVIDQVKVLAQVNKKFPKLDFDYLTAITPLFLNTNAKVQDVTAKLINALPVRYEALIPESLAPYKSSMTGATRKMLEKWLDLELEMKEVSSRPVGEMEIQLGETVQTCESVEDVLFAAAAVFKKGSSAQHFELFLDGVFRFMASDKERLLAGLKKQQKNAEKLYAGYGNFGALPWVGRIIGEVVLRLIGAELDKGRESYAENYDVQDTFLATVAARVTEVLELVRSETFDHSLPLLAAPETSLGFIEPSTLVSRLEQWRAAGVEVMRHDFLLAISRCHFRTKSSIVKVDQSTETGRVLHFLLTGERNGAVETEGWWLCAARTREPYGDFSGDEYLKNIPTEFHVWLKPLENIHLNASHESFDPFLRYKDQRRREAVPTEWIYPRMAWAFGNSYDLCGADVELYYSLTPSQQLQALARSCYWLEDNKNCSSFSRNAAVFFKEIIHRELPMSYPKATLMILALGKKKSHSHALDLWVQAEELNQVQPNISLLGDVLGEAVINNPHVTGIWEDHSDFDFTDLIAGFETLEGDEDVSEKLRFLTERKADGTDEPEKEKPYHSTFDHCQIIVALPCIRELVAMGAPFDRNVRDILSQAFKQQLVYPTKGLAKLLELYRDLLITYPLETSLDLNEYWDLELKGQLKTIANKIAKM